MHIDSKILEVVTKSSSKVSFLYNVVEKKLLYISNSFFQIFGAAFSSVPKDVSAVLSLIHPHDKNDVFEHYAGLGEKSFTEEFECRIILPDKSQKFIFCNISSSVEEGKLIWLGGYVKDITKTKETEFLANQYAANKNSMLEILCHDIGGNLGMIESINSMIVEKGNSSDCSELTKYTRLIQNICASSMNLIINFTTKEFMDSAKLTLKIDRINLVERVKGIIETYKSGKNLVAKHFYLKTSSEEIMVELDDIKFLQSINNLVSNAIKFTPENGTITISLEEKEKTILVSVKDNGVGIPDDLKPFLFDEHTKAQRPGLRGEKSIGLGMSIVKKMIELHQGKIWFESKENEGSTFYIEIPKRNLSSQK